MSDFPIFPIVFLGVMVAFFIVVSVLSWRWERRRKEELASIASRLAFTFSPDASRDIAEEFHEFRGMNTGENRYAFCVLEGSHLARNVRAFDFHYETHSTDSKGNRSTTHHCLHVVTLGLEREFPRLFIAPEGIFSKIAQAFGYDDIDFESHEFSRRFCVRSADRKFAYDFCNAAMMDFLLAHTDLQIETRDGILALVFEGKMDPRQIESEFDLACSIRDRMPEYLFAAA